MRSRSKKRKNEGILLLLFYSFNFLSLISCVQDDITIALQLLEDVNLLSCCVDEYCSNILILSGGFLQKIDLQLDTCDSGGGTFDFTTIYSFTTLTSIEIKGTPSIQITGDLRIEVEETVDVNIKNIGIATLDIAGGVATTSLSGTIEYNPSLTLIVLSSIEYLEDFKVHLNANLLNITANNVVDLKGEIKITENKYLHTLSLSEIALNPSWTQNTVSTITLSSNGFDSPSSFPSTFTELDFSRATLNYNPFCAQCPALLASGYDDCIDLLQCLPCMPNATSCYAYNSSANHVSDTFYIALCCNFSCNPLYADCDDQLNNGCELYSLTELQICGKCGSECLPRDNVLLYSCNSTSNVCQIDKCQEGFADCDSDYVTGCETDIFSYVGNCGSCSHLCVNPNASTVLYVTCNDGVCELHCKDGFADCNGVYGDGCERPLGTTSNCAYCNNSCSSNHVNSSQCISSSCVIYSCINGYADCDNSVTNGCESNLFSFSTCGSCNQTCVINPNNAVSNCNTGQCRITCNSGYGNCDNVQSNGCESYLSTDVLNCGSCGYSCSSLYRVNTSSCFSSQCIIQSCLSGYFNCDTNITNGCEVNLVSDPKNCGSCSNNCNLLPHVSSTSCVNSKCSIASCSSFYADCDTSAQSGCEAYLKNDTLNCGACGKNCLALPHVDTAICESSKCVIQSCDAGFEDCDGLVSNGCETNVNYDVTKCGDCNNDCSSLPNVKTSSCNNGVCGILTCKSNFGDCDLNLSNGCESSLFNTVTKCGNCSNNCLELSQVNSATCVSGKCVISNCKSPFSNCDNNVSNGCETNLQTLSNCGACGYSCLSLPHIEAVDCNSGVCTIVNCKSGFMNCDSSSSNGCEINTLNNTSNCNGCGLNCLNLPQVKNASCVNGECVILSCKTGYANCEASNPGCETYLSASDTNCGTCGKNCNALPHVHAAQCVSSSCKIVECEEDFGDCDDIVENGCEVSLRTNSLHCNDCSIDCMKVIPNVISALCVNGDCTVGNCSTNWMDCDSMTLGCETNVATTATRCGNCSTNCNTQFQVSSAICSQRKCVVQSCNTDFGDCDNDGLTGCETYLPTTATNCGSCQNNCTIYKKSSNHVADVLCVNGKCALICEDKYANCDGHFNNGCEAYLGDINTCTSCNLSCNSLPNVKSSSCNVLNGCSLICKPNYSDCDGNITTGCETPINVDIQNCGACNHPCSPPYQSFAYCLNNTCGYSCNSGYADCDTAISGCETNTLTNKTRCGSCSLNCLSLPNVNSATCQSGICHISTCADGYDDCNRIKGDGCETNIASDINNCGHCGISCRDQTSVNQAVCISGICNVTQCNQNTLDCNKDFSDGCETNASSLQNCGGCGHNCVIPNSIAVCINQTCSIGSCSQGFGDCDGLNFNGCEISLVDHPQHCGNCSTNCQNLPQVNQVECSGGECVIKNCIENYDNCNGVVADGCETNIKTDLQNCGGCSDVCPPSSQNVLSAFCNNRSCIIHCMQYFDDCNNDLADGCETDLRSLADCGSCNNNCSSLSNVALTYCDPTASCIISSCAEYYYDCDRNVNNGCEVDIRSDVTHCGNCSTNCISIPNTNPLHASCLEGGCFYQCAADYQDCNMKMADGCETSVLNNTTHCGSCGTDCSKQLLNVDSVSCIQKNCGGTCKSGYGNCISIVPDDGCETNLYTSVGNCGVCGNDCTLLEKVTAANCVDGKCIITNCSSGYLDCDKLGANGCETSLLSDPFNCGECRNNCEILPNVNKTQCTEGVCEFLCDPSYFNADGIVSNGCEINTNSNRFYCGVNRTNCSSTLVNAVVDCVGGNCVIVSCNPGYANCNNDNTDGCEVNLSDIAHCGICNISCSNLLHVTNPTCISQNGSDIPYICSYNCRKDSGNCDGIILNGCETTLGSTDHCADCNDDCNHLPNVGDVYCADSTHYGESVFSCSITSCAIGYDNCDQLDLNGCETDLSLVTSCGDCDTDCSSLPNIQSATCLGGSTAGDRYSNCNFTCLTGFDHCSDSFATGCETNLRTDVFHCGTCDTDCSILPHTNSTICQFGICRIQNCSRNFADCDRKVENGCEADLTSSSHCGACNHSCSDLRNVQTSYCDEDECVILDCHDGFANCDNNAENGCEVNILLSEFDCGGCDLPCYDLNHTITSNCNQGSCTFLCDRNFGNCDSLISNGCEEMLSSSLNHCGGCDVSCINLPNAASTDCVDSNCIISCDVGYADCDRDNMNGCEVAVTSAVEHCGTCSRDCTSLDSVEIVECVDSKCIIVECTPGYQDCDAIVENGCELLITDTDHCGSCYQNCSALPHSLLVSCIPPLSDNNRLYQRSDPPASSSSSSSSSLRLNIRNSTTNDCKCKIVYCEFEYGDCDANEENGCEEHLNSIDHCGACNRSCSFANAEVGCLFGVCEMLQCNSGYANCDQSVINGCETNLESSTQNCGECDHLCSYPNAITECINAKCILVSCNPGFINADEDNTNGCEVITNNNNNDDNSNQPIPYYLPSSSPPPLHSGHSTNQHTYNDGDTTSGDQTTMNRPPLAYSHYSEYNPMIAPIDVGLVVFYDVASVSYDASSVSAINSNSFLSLQLVELNPSIVIDGDTSFISPIVDISTFHANIESTTFTICFNLNSSSGSGNDGGGSESDSTKDMCLAYRDTNSNDWKCEDKCLKKKKQFDDSNDASSVNGSGGFIVCGKSTHLTDFTVLFGGIANNGGKCGNSENDYILGSYNNDLILIGCVAGFVVLLAILFIIVVVATPLEKKLIGEEGRRFRKLRKFKASSDPDASD